MSYHHLGPSERSYSKGHGERSVLGRPLIPLGYSLSPRIGPFPPTLPIVYTCSFLWVESRLFSLLPATSRALLRSFVSQLPPESLGNVP